MKFTKSWKLPSRWRLRTVNDVQKHDFAVLSHNALVFTCSEIHGAKHSPLGLGDSCPEGGTRGGHRDCYQKGGFLNFRKGKWKQIHSGRSGLTWFEAWGIRFFKSQSCIFNPDSVISTFSDQNMDKNEDMLKEYINVNHEDLRCSKSKSASKIT